MATSRTGWALRLRRALLLLSLCAAGPAIAQDTKPVEIRQWTVPWGHSLPRDPYVVGPDSVWFVGQDGNYLASFNPRTGEFKKLDLTDQPGPNSVLVGRDGIVWYAANRLGYIGRHDPRTGEIRRIALPDPAARDPHTMVFDAGEQHIWFTVQGGGFVGRLDLASEAIDLIRVPTPSARPYGIAIAPDGKPWVALFGTNKIASIDPKSLALTEHVLPRADARPRRVGFTSDGRVWYADYALGYLGAFDPKTKTVAEWLLPAGEASRPFGLAVDARDHIWLVETGASPSRLVGFDPKQKKFTSMTRLPSREGTIRRADFQRGTGPIWFGTDNDTIGYFVP